MNRFVLQTNLFVRQRNHRPQKKPSAQKERRRDPIPSLLSQIGSVNRADRTDIIVLFPRFRRVRLTSATSGRSCFCRLHIAGRLAFSRFIGRTTSTPAVWFWYVLIFSNIWDGI
jgi:hypothetical protein